MKTAKLEGSGMKLSTFVNIALSRATYLRPASSYLSLQSNKYLDRSSLESQPMELTTGSWRGHSQAVWLGRGKIWGAFLRPVHIQTFATGDDKFARGTLESRSCPDHSKPNKSGKKISSKITNKNKSRTRAVRP